MTTREDARTSKYITRLFLVVFAAATVLCAVLLFDLFTPIVLASVLYALFKPVYDRILPLVRGRATVASGITTAVVVVVVAVPIGLFVSLLSQQAAALYLETQNTEFFNEIKGLAAGEGGLAARLQEFGARFGVQLTPERFVEIATQAANRLAGFTSTLVSGAAGNVIGLLVGVGLIITVLAALFVDGPRLKEYLFDLSPLPQEQEQRLVERFAEMAKAVFVGNGVASIAQGFFGGIGFSLFGLGGGAVWGTAIAFFAFLPVVGASVVVIPALVILVLRGHYAVAFGFALYNLLYILILEYWLKTKMSSGGVNSILIFLGIVAGLRMFGMLGLFYGPLIIAMFLTLADIYREDYRDVLTKGA